MPDNPPARSVKIGADERTGWSSERPRRDAGPPRPPDMSVRCRVLAPTDRMRYSPGSLVIVVGAPASEAAKFADRVIQERGAVLSLARVRTLLAGRVPEGEIDARAVELLAAAVGKRLQAGQSVVVPVETLDPAEREPFIRIAHGFQRPRHVILVEAARDAVDDADRPVLDELRRALDAGELGQEGFQTALRLSGPALAELKRVVFARRPPED
jgi:predicted kinase